jgi:hypothetical protein
MSTDNETLSGRVPGRGQGESLTRSHDKVEPPRDADMAAAVQTISGWSIRPVCHLGYLEGGIDDAVATGKAPRMNDESARAWPRGRVTPLSI